MPLDAVCLKGVVQELKPQLENLRLEKIQQPARDLVLLTFRGNRRLLLCAGANQSRIHLTALQRENPAAAAVDSLHCKFLQPFRRSDDIGH